MAICCLNITLNGGKLLLRGIEQQQQICNTGSGQMEAIMRACIVIGTLVVLAVSARIYTTTHKIDQSPDSTVPSIARIMMPVTSGRNNVTSTTTTIVQMAMNLFMKAVSPTPTKPIVASARPQLGVTMTNDDINRGEEEAEEDWGH